MKFLNLLPGEVALKNAPSYKISSDRQCIPQHYLSYKHNLDSVEQLIMNVEYSPQYPIFVSEDAGGIYLQVGIIGYDNYQTHNEQPKTKIVYGRKWRVETQLPTSEIIQTALLAIKVAREHEIRELFRMSVEDKSTTPFNNHHDLPLLSQNKANLIDDKQSHSCSQLQQCLNSITYDGATFLITDIQQRRSNTYIMELEVVPSAHTKLPELLNQKYITLITQNSDKNELLFELMSQLIQLSNRHVEENFQYSHVARFSRNLQIERIAELSVNTRQLHKENELQEFANQWKITNYETDLTRVPEIKSPQLAKKIQACLAHFQPLEGVLPKLNLSK
jgi:hemerythrin